MRHPVAAVLVLVRRRTRPGRAPTPPPTRSAATSRTWSTSSTCARASSSASRSTGCEFDEDEGVWTVTTTGRKRVPRPHRRAGLRARCPTTSCPDIRGLDTYEGHKIHSARWDHDYDFTGKRVAVIGTGASAVQIVPELVKQAEFVKVFQRTPGWVLPRLDVATPAAAQALFAKVPAAQAACPPGAVLGPRGQRDRAGVGHPADRAGRPAGQGAPAQAGQGPVAAPSAHAGLHPGLQADAGLQRLLPGAAARQLQAHRLADRHHEPGRDPHQRRRRAPPGLHRVRHRLRRAPDRTAVPGHRDRRPLAAPTSGPAARRPTRASTPTATRTCSS